MIILDNLRIHKSKETLSCLMKSWALYLFLSTYSPEMAPIELIFGLEKRRLIKQTSGKNISLSPKDGEKKIRKVFGKVSNGEIQSCFNYCFKLSEATF